MLLGAVDAGALAAAVGIPFRTQAHTLSAAQNPSHTLLQTYIHDWAREFHAFTLEHLVTVFFFGFFMLGSVILGRHFLAHNNPRAERRLRLGWVWLTLLWQTAAVVYYLLPANFDPYESWPLHLCDIAAWIAPFALLTERPRLRALLYFWGIGLSTQAFLTPILPAGYGDIRFWLFFVGHTQIVGSALYDVTVLGYRPSLRDWGFVTIVSFAWMAAVLPINLLFNLNYGYTGRELPDPGTLLDYLGPWPWRIGSLIFVGQAALAISYVVWPIARRIRRKSTQKISE